MLKVFCGGNLKKAAAEFLLEEKKHRAVRIESETKNLEEVARHSSMFDGTLAYSIRDIEDLPAHAGYLAMSVHAFIILSSINKDEKKRIEKAGGEIAEFNFSEFEQKAIEKSEKQLKNRIYAVADALNERDRRKIWITYHKLLAHGFAAEEVYWKLSWQVKNILIASQTRSAAEAGLHEFVYGKARAASGKYSREELEKLSGNLLDLWRDTHNGRKELPLALEQFILGI